jgi:hypothetical protein
MRCWRTWQARASRDPDAIRIVPIPPLLVRALQEHIKEFATATDGRLFRNERGGILGSTTYSRVLTDTEVVGQLLCYE